tara:strand:- start:367 stop:672 length:306 start_codon:yes stop_codon:yes gene_type:complete
MRNIRSDVQVAVALVVQDIVDRGGEVDRDAIEWQVVSLIDALVVLPEPYDALSDIFIGLIVDRALDKAFDERWRQKVLRDVSIRAKRIQGRIQTVRENGAK